MGEVGDDEATCRHALADEGAHQARAHLGGGGVVLRDRTAKRDAREEVEVAQNGVGDRAADIVEIDVDAVGAGGAEGRIEILLGLVVDAGIEAEVILHEGAFLGAARDADGAAAHELGDLAHDLADGTGGSRHHDRLAGLGLADMQQAEIGGHARHAEHAVGGRDRRDRGIDLAQGGAAADRIFLPAETVLDDVADLEAVMRRLHHFAHRAAGHHLVEADRRSIGGGIAHPAALIGIEREIVHLHQHLAVPRLGHRRFLDAKVGFGRLARRTAHENDTAMGLGNAGWAAHGTRHS